MCNEREVHGVTNTLTSICPVCGHYVSISDFARHTAACKQAAIARQTGYPVRRSDSSLDLFSHPTRTG